jgi:hypothetical protein
MKMDLREIGLEDEKSIHVVQDRDQLQAVVNMVKNLQVL